MDAIYYLDYIIQNVIERSVLDLRTTESNEVDSRKAKDIHKKMNSMLGELESLKTQMAKRSKVNIG